MIFSLAGIFVSPFGVLFISQFIYGSSHYQAQAAPITYLDEKTCQELFVGDDTGSTTRDASSERCIVKGTLELSSNYPLVIREGLTLEISGKSSELWYAGFQTLVNNGAISLTQGATFINVKDLADPENPREALLLNRGIFTIDEKRTVVNQARIDNSELEGRIINHGTFENRGLVYSNNIIENRGRFTDSGYLWSYNTDLLMSQGKKVIIVNYGVMRNYGAIDNSSGEFYNYGTVENFWRLGIGTLHNYATVENYAGTFVGEMVYNYCGAATIVAQQLLWRSNYCGAATIVAQQLLWRSNYCGAATIVAQQLLWRSNYCGCGRNPNERDVHTAMTMAPSQINSSLS